MDVEDDGWRFVAVFGEEDGFAGLGWVGALDDWKIQSGGDLFGVPAPLPLGHLRCGFSGLERKLYGVARLLRREAMKEGVLGECEMS